MYKQPQQLGQFQGATGDQLVAENMDSTQQLLVYGIDMVPASGVAMAWVLTLGLTGTRFYGAAQIALDPLKPYQWRGYLPLNVNDSIWVSEAGGSIDVLCWGVIVPYPVLVPGAGGGFS